MNQKEIPEFYTPKNQNDVDHVEKIIYPLFSKRRGAAVQYRNIIRSHFLAAMKNAQLDYARRHLFWIYVQRTISKGVKKGRSLNEVENTLRNFIRNKVDRRDKKTFAAEWAKRNLRLIRNYIQGSTILDLGAGTGLLALEIKNQLNKEVILVDVIDYNLTDLPLILYDPDEKIPLSDGAVDTTVLCTVVHHAGDPRHLLQQAARITKQRLIIVDGYIEEEEMKISNSFFDWFYNRVLGDQNIYVPLNFFKLQEWKKLLHSVHFSLSESRNLGINDPVIPEHHILIIADRICP